MVNRIWRWYNNLTNRTKTSINLSVTLVGVISTIMSVAGVSLYDWTQNVRTSLIIIAFVFIGIAFAIYYIIGCIFKNSISIVIRHNQVSISYGDIFKEDALRVIGCDTHFDTRVDDVVISNKSLHGQLVLKHGRVEEIKMAVNKEAQRINLTANDKGFYDFPLGSIVRYKSSVDNQTYLMLALTKLDDKNESHTNMAEFEQTLIKTWSEISRVYAGNDVAIPVLGTGISRFDDGPKNKESLLRCMLCTLNCSGVTLNSKIKVIIFGDASDISLYEYKDIFKLFGK